MERRHGHVRAAQAALQERPEVFKAVCMDVTSNVFKGVVNEMWAISTHSGTPNRAPVVILDALFYLPILYNHSLA